MQSKQRQAKTKAQVPVLGGGGGILGHKEGQAGTKKTVQVRWGKVSVRLCRLVLGDSPCVDDELHVPLALSNKFIQLKPTTFNTYTRTSFEDPQLRTNEGRRALLLAEGYTKSELLRRKREVLKAKKDSAESGLHVEAQKFANESAEEANRITGAVLKRRNPKNWANKKWKGILMKGSKSNPPCLGAVKKCNTRSTKRLVKAASLDETVRLPSPITYLPSSPKGAGAAVRRNPRRCARSRD